MLLKREAVSAAVGAPEAYVFEDNVPWGGLGSEGQLVLHASFIKGVDFGMGKRRRTHRLWLALCCG
jgi:hypothetical protein